MGKNLVDETQSTVELSAACRQISLLGYSHAFLRIACSYPSLETQLWDILHRSGLVVTCVDDAIALTIGASEETGVIVSISVGRHDAHEHHSASASMARLHDMPWLHVTCMEAGRLILGPLFFRDSIPCYRCFSAMLDSYPTFDAGPLCWSNASVATMAAAISLEILNMSVTLRRTQSVRTVTCYDLKRITTAEIMVARMPGCSSCWPRLNHIHSQPTAFSISALFEECARTRVGPESTVLDLGYLKRAGAEDPKYFPNCTKLSLERWNELYEYAISTEHDTPRDKVSISESDLTNLLVLSFGRLDVSPNHRHERALPSGGNLGSAEAFLIVRDVSGLSPGVYYYESQYHQLALLRTPRQLDPGRLIMESGICSPGHNLPPAVVFISGAFERISVKYGAFAFRLIHLDAGVALARLTIIARALGLEADDLAFWRDDVLEEHLLLRSFNEPIVGGIAFNIKSPPKTALRPESFRANEDVSVHVPLNSLQIGMTPMSLVRTLYERSRSDASPAITLGQNCDNQTRVARQDRSLSDVWSTTVTRQSCRKFLPDKVDLLLAERIVDASFETGISRNAESLTRVFVSLAADNLPLHDLLVYSFCKESRRLVEHASISHSGEAGKMFVDKSYAEAPAVFWVCGDVACHPRRYRRLLVEAGRSIHDLMTAADDHGLSGVITAGIWSHVVGRFLKFNHVEESPLIAFVAGFNTAHV